MTTPTPNNRKEQFLHFVSVELENCADRSSTHVDIRLAEEHISNLLDSLLLSQQEEIEKKIAAVLTTIQAQACSYSSDIDARYIYNKKIKALIGNLDPSKPQD